MGWWGKGGEGRGAGKEKEPGAMALWPECLYMPSPPSPALHKFICRIVRSGWLLEGVGLWEVIWSAFMVEPSYNRDPRELLPPFLHVRPGLEDGHD